MFANVEEFADFLSQLGLKNQKSNISISADLNVPLIENKNSGCGCF